MARKEISLADFRKVIPKGTQQDREEHHCSGATLYWNRNGKTYEEIQYDIGQVERFVSD